MQKLYRRDIRGFRGKQIRCTTAHHLRDALGNSICENLLRGNLPTNCKSITDQQNYRFNQVANGKIDINDLELRKEMQANPSSENLGGSKVTM
jgi:hypothetical protein